MKKTFYLILVCFALLFSCNTVKNYIVTLRKNPAGTGGLCGRILEVHVKKANRPPTLPFWSKLLQKTTIVSLYKQNNTHGQKSLVKVAQLKTAKGGKFFFNNVPTGNYILEIPSPYCNEKIKYHVTILPGLDAGIFAQVPGKNFRRDFTGEIKKKYAWKGKFHRILIKTNWQPKPAMEKKSNKPIDEMTFYEFRSTVQATANITLKNKLVKEYLALKHKAKAIPIIESNRVFFLVDASGDDLADEPISVDVGGLYVQMYRIKNTSLLFAEVKIPLNKVQEYQFCSLSPKMFFPDQFHKKDILLSGYGKRSKLEMPLYKGAWVFAEHKWVRKGTIVHISNYKSKYIGLRDIHVYLPPGYRKSKKRFPVLYMQDGQTHIKGKINIAFNNMIHFRKIPKIICVLIEHGAYRTEEYVPNADLKRAHLITQKMLNKHKGRPQRYVSFVAKELVPYINKKYRTINNRKFRAIAGQSFGAWAAFYIGFKHPELFSKVGGQSGFWVRGYKKSKKLDLDLYFDVGSFSHDIGIRKNLKYNIKNVFKPKGYRCKVIQQPGGHSPLYWLPYLEKMISFFWGKGKR